MTINKRPKILCGPSNGLHTSANVSAGLYQKIFRSHFTIVLICVVALLIILVLLLRLRLDIVRVVKFQVPMSHVATRALGGVQSSLSAVRGWMALGDRRFKLDRNRAWDDEILPALIELKILGATFESERDQDSFSKVWFSQLNKKLLDLYDWQWRIEDIAQTPGNEPAYVKFIHEIQPIVTDIYSAIRGMVDLEDSFSHDFNRNMNLRTLTELQVVFTRSQSILSDIVKEYDEEKEGEFFHFAYLTSDHRKDLAIQAELFKTEQAENFLVLTDKLSIYKILAKDMIEIRKAKRWNLAQYWMTTRVVPLEREVTTILSDFSLRQNKLMEADSKVIMTLTNWFLGILIVLSISLIIVTQSKSRSSAARITNPILLLSEAATRLAEGALDDDIPVQELDEVGQLTQSFNAMRAAISEKKEELTKSETKIRMIVDTVNDGIIVIDQEGNIDSVNPVGTQVFGYSNNELIGRNFKSLIPAPYDKEYDDYIKYFTENRKKRILSSVRQIQGKRNDGSLFPIELSVNEMQIGDHWMFTALVRDITDRNQAEVELKEAKKCAEQAEGEVRIALEESENLRKIAEQANLAKSEFLANMSHELRTPLNGITGFTEMVLDDSLSREQRESLNIVKQCSDTLLELINNILDLSKIEAEKTELENISFDIEKLVYNCTDIIRGKLEDKRLEILVDIGDVHFWVTGDSTRLQQVLLNLLSNSIKFTEQGEVLIRLRTLEETDESTCIEFTVHDSGIGMSEDQQRVIFEAFRQADGSTTRKYGGTGLGLAICKKLVTLMGGKISVHSEVEIGTRFSFQLTFAKALRVGSTHSTCLMRQGLSGKHCLIVEDNPIAVRITNDLVSRIGMIPTTASSAEEGFQCLSNNPDIEIVLIDILLPKVDGFMFIDRIKRDVSHCSPFLIANTADTSPATLSRIKASTFDGYLLKPLRKLALTKMIYSFFNNQDPPQSQQPTSEEQLQNTDGPGTNVLVVEDNLVNQKVAVKMLQRMGHDVRVADDGLKALEILNRDRFDIIFMDMQMPIMDGLTATQEIRQRGITTPIVAMTANAMQGDRKRCLEAGMNDYVSKPIKRDIVRDILWKYCPKSRLTLIN